MSDPSEDPPSKEELARREEVRRKMRELLDKRNAIPESERKPLSRPERFEDFPIGMDDAGNLYEDKGRDKDGDKDGTAGGAPGAAPKPRTRP
jgi:hypothetical protein